MNKLRKWGVNIALVFVAWFFIHCWWIVYTGKRHFTGQADVAIVLGNTAFAVDSISPWLQGRVDEALQLYRQQQVKKIFVSGGIGENGVPEGDAMANYLVVQGVPAADIVVDNYGDNTYLTARNFCEYNRQQQFSSAVVVTSFYHVPRARYILQKLGFPNVSGSSSRSRYWADWYGLTREVVAFYKYWIIY